MLKLAYKYMRYYKRQTAALLIGILLSTALLTGIGSLFASGKEAAKENARTEYGDWHYNIRSDYSWFADFKRNQEGAGFDVEKYGVETVKKAIADPFDIQYVSADEKYLEIMDRELLEGKMPEENNEMAMDLQTLRNLEISEAVGSEFELDGETFILCGILTEMPEKVSELLGNCMQIYVAPNLDYGTNGSFLYVKFEENKPVYQQMQAFQKQYGIDNHIVSTNKGLAGYVGAYSETILFSEIYQALRDPTMGLPYAWSLLNENDVLTETAVLIALAFFCAFIIYSIFQVSVLKRLSQYSIMQTLGMTGTGTFRVLMCELLLVFAGAYAGGCVLGNGAAALIYSKTGRIFITRNVDRHSGVSVGENASKLSVSDLSNAGAFHIDWQIIVYSAIFLLLFLAVISVILVRKMNTLTLRQMIVKDTSKARKSRKIYSLKRDNLTGILTKRFMFSRKGTFTGILLSLSIGSVMFLGAAYVAENTRINNRLTFAADDGLESDIQVYEESDRLSDIIPEQTVEQIKSVEGLKSVLPVRYMLGEIPLDDGSLKWTSYFPETAKEDIEGFDPDPEIMEKYNGQIVQTGDDDYKLKVNIYGYDDEMLEKLNDYLLEGNIDPDQMRGENTVILKTLMDGQGNYDGIDLKSGDEVQVRAPKDADAEPDILKFLSDEQNYSALKLKIDGVVSRPLGKVETFIGDTAGSNVDIIMTNEQMEKNFGVTGYRIISISLNAGADASKCADEIRTAASGIKKCVVKDYTSQIEAQNLYLNQQMMFFYGIAAVLLGISLLHIMNSMQYLVAERKHEFAILRAMGITDSGFLRMLAKEGMRYGVYSSIVMFLLYFIVQKVLYYFMTKVYLYLHPQRMISAGYLVCMAALNLVICIAAMIISGKNILKQSILA